MQVKNNTNAMSEVGSVSQNSYTSRSVTSGSQLPDSQSESDASRNPASLGLPKNPNLRSSKLRPVDSDLESINTADINDRLEGALADGLAGGDGIPYPRAKDSMATSDVLSIGTSMKGANFDIQRAIEQCGIGYNQPHLNERLVLSHRGFQEPPDALEAYVNLKSLDLTNNGLVRVRNLDRLQALQNLVLTSNSLNVLTPRSFLFNSNLRILNLSYNNISRVEPGTFSHLVQLENLNLGHNMLKDLLYPQAACG